MLILKVFDDKSKKRKSRRERLARESRMNVYRQREWVLMEKASRLDTFNRINEIRKQCIEA